MRRTGLAALLGGVAVGVVLLGGGRAGAWPGDHEGLEHAHPYPRPTVYPGDYQYGAPWYGSPCGLRHCTAPSDTGHYCGYYVGGGSAYHGDPRTCDEGTWGWDYCGLVLPKRVALGWWHDRCYQGGIGSYRVNGAKCDSKSTP